MKLAHAVAEGIAEASPDTRVKIYNVANIDKNDIMTDVFRSKAIAVGCPTVGSNILSAMSGWLTFLEELKFREKKAGVFGCYGWSGESTKLLRERLEKSGFEVLGDDLRCHWNPREEQLDEARALGATLAKA